MSACHHGGVPGAETLIDREREIRELRALLESGEPKLALLTGRRRVGKTYLLTHAWPEQATFFFTASRTSAEINRRQLVTEWARWSRESVRAEDYPTWRTVFRLLLGSRRREPYVIVIDEFPYLAAGADGLAEVASELNAVWERQDRDRRLVLALAGSAVATMEALASGGSPLYGRFDWQGRLGPFDYWHAARVAPFSSLRDAARTFAVFGGTPRYLVPIDASRSFADNVTTLCLSPRGEVRQLVETALEQEEGLRDTAPYHAILRVVAAGSSRRNDIAQRAGLNNDSGLRHRLGQLVELGYLRERKNFGAKPNEAVQYVIEDPAVRFHQRFVLPNLSLLERAPPEAVWTEIVRPQLPGYVGHEFERIARQAYDRLQPTLGLPLVRAWGRWEGSDRLGRSLEVDLVASHVGDSMLTGAVKWSSKPVGAKLHFDHLDMLYRLRDAGRAWAHRALDPGAQLIYVSAAGFTEGFRAAAEESGLPVHAWDLGDLYQDV